ncbi:MAG: VOC family protein [Actinomycetota bacterium]|nr:VOC family protein [Actinomycetota bacterium]
MTIKRVDVVPVYVSDQDSALEFYVHKLGMEKLRDEAMGPDARWVQVKPQGGETSIVLVKGFADWSPDKVGGLQSMTLWSDDAETTAEELRARGVEVSQEATPQPWGMNEVPFQRPGRQRVPRVRTAGDLTAVGARRSESERLIPAAVVPINGGTCPSCPQVACLRSARPASPAPPPAGGD